MHRLAWSEDDSQVQTMGADNCTVISMRGCLVVRGAAFRSSGPPLIWRRAKASFDHLVGPGGSGTRIPRVRVLAVVRLGRALQFGASVWTITALALSANLISTNVRVRR